MLFFLKNSIVIFSMVTMSHIWIVLFEIMLLMNTIVLLEVGLIDVWFASHSI